MFDESPRPWEPKLIRYAVRVTRTEVRSAVFYITAESDDDAAKAKAISKAKELDEWRTLPGDAPSPTYSAVLTSVRSAGPVIPPITPAMGQATTRPQTKRKK